MVKRTAAAQENTETRVPLLEALTPSGRDLLLRASTERSYAAGQRLWSSGDFAAGVTLVLSGRVRVVRTAGARQTLIHVGEPGATLGEIPFFTGRPYPATAIAAEPTRCLLIGRDAIEQLIDEDSSVAWIFFESLALRVTSLVDRIDQLSLLSVDTRLARFLVSRSQRVAGRARQRASTDGVPPAFNLGMTQAALADELGTVREVIVRSLRHLSQAGIIAAAGGGRYRVLDIDALSRASAVRR